MFGMQLQNPGTDLSAAVQPVEVPLATELAANQVRIAVSACAMCRTDLQLCSGDLAAHTLPVFPGHQVVGEIVEVGVDVEDHRIGQKVGLVWLGYACGVCRFCLRGQENLCNEALFTGYDINGGYAQQVVAFADFAIPIPSLKMPDEAVAPLLCGGVIGYRALRIAGVLDNPSGLRLGHYGFGASASLAIQVANYLGAESYVITRSPAEAERARSLGAEWAGTYDDELPGKLDAAITYAPVGWVVTRALSDLDKGGRVAINAIHLPDIPVLDYDQLWWERSISSVANVTRQDVTEFLDLVGPAGVTTAFEDLPLADAVTGLQRVRDGDITGAFVMKPNA